MAQQTFQGASYVPTPGSTNCDAWSWFVRACTHADFVPTARHFVRAATNGNHLRSATCDSLRPSIIVIAHAHRRAGQYWLVLFPVCRRSRILVFLIHFFSWRTTRRSCD